MALGQTLTDYLRISSVTRASTGVQLTWTSVPSVSYAVMASSSLTGATWELVRTLTASSTTASVTLASSPRSQYYRLVALP